MISAPRAWLASSSMKTNPSYASGAVFADTKPLSVVISFAVPPSSVKPTVSFSVLSRSPEATV